MKYVNCHEVLPRELVDEIRKYIDGVYVYIPIKEERKFIRSENERQEGLNIRNRRIYNEYLYGKKYDAIANDFFLSEKSVRRIVLGKKREMEGVMEVLKDILKEWHIQGELKQINDTSWSVGEGYVIKVYMEVSMLKRNADVFKTLLNAKIPVPKVIQTAEGKDYFEKGEKGYLVTEKLPGNKIENVEGLDDHWFYRFGEIIGHLHQGFNQCQQSMSYWHNSLLEEMNGWVSDNFNKYHPSFIERRDVQHQISRLGKVYHELPKQLIHRDVHLGNFLFNGEVFTGYVDFDLSQSNIRIFDVCYFLLGLICKESGGKCDDQRWFAKVKNAIAGYDQVMRLTPLEKESIPLVMMTIELLFVAYFLEQDDESLARDAGTLFHFVKDNEERIMAELL